MPLGELAHFALFWGYADVFACSCSWFHVDLVAVTVHAPARCIRMVPWPLAPLDVFCALPGKFDFMQSSWGVLMRSGLF